ncbi:ATPase AAA [Puniceibacterium sp. IMCC21224]|uniref:ATPase AAA n=1 Tax=Puniceibacterium sp. IMCC21224 TaxID=1618204 RepID=UPI00064DE753|nr:ATPase AAA [Puniceibacterium sp. IMCC21224]KMK65438.1 adenylate kinase-like kinase [Puniceibacterium sp. IMCC21224]
MKRVMIVGQPGSGKSTLARRIGRKTDLPVIHMDHIHWQSGWAERPKPQKIILAQEAEAGDLWVFEGGLSATYDTRLARADTLVMLDLPLWLRAWRVFYRTLRYYGRTRPDLPDGCPERFDYVFWKWIWDTRHSGRQQNLALIDRAGPETDVHRLCSPREVNAFLTRLDAGG